MCWKARFARLEIASALARNCLTRRPVPMSGLVASVRNARIFSSFRTTLHRRLRASSNRDWRRRSITAQPTEQRMISPHTTSSCGHAPTPSHGKGRASCVHLTCSSRRSRAMRTMEWLLHSLPIATCGLVETLVSLQEKPNWAPSLRFLAACYPHFGRLGDAQAIAEKVRRITSDLIPSAEHCRIREDREFYLDGLRLAVGVTCDESR